MIEIRCHSKAEVEEIWGLHKGPWDLLFGGLAYRITLQQHGRVTTLGGHTTKAKTIATRTDTGSWVVAR